MLNHALRYAPIISVLEGTPGRSLLEVGSGSLGVASFVSGWDLTACDLSFDDYGGGDRGKTLDARRVTGSVLQLPFKDGSFDVVVALDLLEHVPPPDRPQALRELRRVTGRVLIVGCPCGTAAEAADRHLARFYATQGQPPPEWLVEHLDHGLPHDSELLGAARAGDAVALVPNASTASHERVLRWEATPIVRRIALTASVGLRHLLARPGLSRHAAMLVLNLLGGRNRPPVYRQIAVIMPARGTT